VRCSTHGPRGSGAQDCPELEPNLLLRGGGGAARIHPINSRFTTADCHAGTFTAASAVHIYRGTALPPEYRGRVFSCDPTGKLVHVEDLVPAGATFLPSPSPPVPVPVPAPGGQKEIVHVYVHVHVHVHAPLRLPHHRYVTATSTSTRSSSLVIA
jgi:hypothetical protein